MTIAQQLGRINAAAEISTKAREFVNLARIIAISRGDRFAAQQIAHEHRIMLGPRIKDIVESRQPVYQFEPDVVSRQKAAITAGGTNVGDWSEQLAAYQTLASAFLESLRNFGCFDAMLPSMKRVPFRTRIGASTAVITGSTVPQASAKSISKLSLTNTTLDEIKVAAILILTDELAKFGDAASGNLFATELSNAIAVATDNEFIAQLISGATSFASNGITAEHTRLDLRVLLTAVTTSQRSQLFLITTSGIAKALAMLSTNAGDAAFPQMQYSGGSIGGIQVIVSDGVPAQNIILVDASQLAAASDTVNLSATNQASVQMDSVPDSPPIASSNYISLWQNNYTGLKAERFFGVEKLTTTGVAVLTGANYSGDSPGP